MPIPVWILLVFALWTLLVLVIGLGSYRVGRIFRGQASTEEYAFPDIDKSDWHRRATRAHLNCVENLAIYGAIVLAAVVAQVQSSLTDQLAVAFLIGRILQSLTHLSFKQTRTVTSFRFLFYLVQVGCMFGMAFLVIFHFI